VAARIDADRLWPGRPVSSGRMDAQELDGDAGVSLWLVTGVAPVRLLLRLYWAAADRS